MQKRYTIPAALLLLAVSATAAIAAVATPTPTSAVLHTRVFNDCPISVLNTTNNFPALIKIDDQNQPPDPLCSGFANLHTWRFSTDGANPIEFQNADAFCYSATLVLDGIGEGGLNMSPWWSPDVDGLFNVRTTDGEVACFGGRMPYFNFTAAFGLVYQNNTPIKLGITYFPRQLNSAHPAQIVYDVTYNFVNYTSGYLNFDEGNTTQDPPRGLWGALNPWYAGGHTKMFAFPDATPHGITATWSNIDFCIGTVGVKKTSWGELKQIYR